jgi:D-alanyl-D-alanine carboxypeptidase
MKKFYLPKFISLIIFISIAAPSRASVNPALDSALQHCLDSLLLEYGLKGMTAAAYIPGQGMWQGVAGVSHDTVPIDSNMILSMGSITKTFISAEIFKLIEAGQLSLDDTIGSLLPPMDYVRGDIKIRNLLGHRSGLAEYLGIDWQNAMLADPYRIWSGAEALDSFLTPATGVPGSGYVYRNTNYALLGMIIESLTGDSLHHVLRNNFFTPLNLDDTYMYVFDTYTNPVPHMWSAPNFDPNFATDEWATPRVSASSSTSAAGGLYSTAEDLAWWGYNLYSGNVISDSSIAAITTFYPVAASYYNGYGLGCMRFPYGGRNYWGHAGNFWGYAACMMYYPQDSISVGALMNIDCYSANATRPLMHLIVNSLITEIESYNESHSINIYPNPVNSQFRIHDSRCIIEEVELFNVVGERVNEMPYSVNKNEAVVNIENLNPGIYFVKVISGERTRVEKLIVE